MEQQKPDKIFDTTKNHAIQIFRANCLTGLTCYQL
jgi:hypothetical protein